MRRRSRITSESFALSVLAVVLTSASIAMAEEPLRLTASDAGGLTVVVEPGALSWRRIERTDGVTLFEPRLEGYSLAGAPGRPNLPVAAGRLVVPPGHRARLEVVEERWRDVEALHVAPVTTPVIRGVDEEGRPFLGEALLLPGEKAGDDEAVLDPDQFAAAVAVHEVGPFHLGEPAPWRGRRVSSLRVSPLEVGADGIATRVLERVVLRVTFVPDAGAPAAGPTRRGDDRFASTLLNGALLKTLPAEPATARAVKRRPHKRGTLLAPEVRLPATKTRLVRIEAATLNATGLLDLGGVDERHLRVYQRRAVADQPGVYEEIEVPIHVFGDGGAFSSGESFVFWGLRCRDDLAFTDDDGEHAAVADPDEFYNPGAFDTVNGGNIYYLAASEPDVGEDWDRMVVVDLPPASDSLESSYRRTDFMEEDTHHLYQPAHEGSDRYAWNTIRTSLAQVPLDVTNPLAGRDDVRMRVGLMGFGSGNKDFELWIDQSGAIFPLGSMLDVNHLGDIYDSQGPEGTTISSDWLLDSSLSLKNKQPGINVILGYLDWYELDYEAAYSADGNSLDFHLGDGVGLRHVEVTGFTNDDLLLLDVSDPREPLMVGLDGDNVVDAGGTWTLSLAAQQDASRGRLFQAAATGGVPNYQYFRASRVTNTEDPTVAPADGLDVLVITHPDFRDQAERWIDYRRDHHPDPLTFRVVETHQLYDAFSGGLKHPDAIKAMTALAVGEWGAWAVQIFGDAYQNVRSLGEEEGVRDWVPSRWHVWSDVTLPNELLPSDKWFVTLAAGPNFPDDTWFAADAIIGRFPGSSPDQIDDMIDKVVTFEAATGAWKKNLVVMADDAWSDGYESAGSNQHYQGHEEIFETEQDTLALRWEEFGCEDGVWCADFGLTASRIMLGDYLDPLSPAPPRDLGQFRMHTRDLVLPDLLAALNAGAMFAHYQGHANDWQLSHEKMMEDTEVDLERRDVSSLTNTGRPWIWIGLGCHISTWARDNTDSAPRGYPSIAEKMLFKPDAGAVATYASPGYEFLHTNARFARVMGNVWIDHPPRAGESDRSRWLLGELFLASEMEMFSLGADPFTRRLVAQYAVLGDALMQLDAGPPLLQVEAGGEVLAAGAELRADDASNRVALTVSALDEGGVARIAVRDEAGADLGAVIDGGTPDGAESDQFGEWTVDLPVHGDGGEVVVHVWDTADNADDDVHTTLSLSMPTDIELFVDGSPFTLGEDQVGAGTRYDFTGTVATALWVAEDATLELTASGATLTGVTLNRVDEHTVDLAFTLEPSEAEPEVVLTIGESQVTFAFDRATQVAGGLRDLAVFPNPIHGDAHFAFRSDGGAAAGRVHVYSLAGHRIVSVPVRPADFQGDGMAAVAWDGRDEYGDRPANGVYLYRVELDTSGGRVASGMERLVVMH